MVLKTVSHQDSEVPIWRPRWCHHDINMAITFIPKNFPEVHVGWPFLDAKSSNNCRVRKMSTMPSPRYFKVVLAIPVHRGGR